MERDSFRGRIDRLSRQTALNSNTEIRKLDTLSGKFDALLVRMQTPAARVAMKSAFNASPKQLGKAAVAAARKRGS